MVMNMEGQSKPEKLAADRYFEFQAIMGVTKHMGGVKATEALADSCRIDRDKYILDIGCGLGRTACYLAKTYGCKVMGIDLSQKMVEQSRKRAKKEGLDDQVEFRTADAQCLPFEANTFDAVIGESVLAFIENRPLAFREFIRVVKPGGSIGFNECTWIKRPPERLVKYMADILGAAFLTPGGWREIWEKSGLQKVSGLSYKVRILEQWGYEIRELDFKAYSGAWLRFWLLLFKSPECRQWARKTLSMPGNILAVFKYFGYGIYTGRKQDLEFPYDSQTMK